MSTADLQRETLRLLEAGQTAVLVTVVALKGHVPTELACKMLVTAAGRRAGTVGGGAIERLAIDEARAVLTRDHPLLKEYLLDEGRPGDDAEATGMVCGGRVTLFFEPLGRSDRAYLVGAGHVNRALQTLLGPLGFAVTFVDFRPEQLASLPVPHLVAGPDYEPLPELPGLAESFVVIATHGHACDLSALEQILRQEARPRYLGVVASRRKRVQLREGLRERLGPEVDTDLIRMPVGLDLGGNTPPDLALSIAAEMQACRHGIDGHRHLGRSEEEA